MGVGALTEIRPHDGNCIPTQNNVDRNLNFSDGQKREGGRIKKQANGRLLKGVDPCRTQYGDAQLTRLPKHN